MNSTQSAPTNTADLALLDAHIDVENAHRDLLLDAKRLRDRLARFIAELEAGEEQASIDPPAASSRRRGLSVDFA